MDLLRLRLETFFHRIAEGLPEATGIVIVALLLNWAISRGFTIFAHKSHLTPKDIAPARRIVTRFVLAVAAVLVLGVFGFQLAGLWGVLSTILAMVAIGFVAVWSVLSNTLCTLLILVFRPFLIGDEIEFVGEPTRGRVIDINFIFTTLRCEDDSTMQVPNNLFFQKVIKRRPGGRTVSLAQQLRREEPAEV